MTSELNQLELGTGLIGGLDLFLFGMAIMSDAMRSLRSHEPFLDFMLSLESVLLAVLVGADFTALVQSWSATRGILIVMAGQGLTRQSGCAPTRLRSN